MNPEDSESTPLTPEEIRHYKHRARSGFVWVLSTTVVWQVLSWGLTLLTARILSAEDYGLLALSETVLTYLLLLGTFRLDAWLMQTDKFDESTQGSIFSLALLLSAVSTALLVGAAPIAAHFYGRAELTAPLSAMAFIFLPRAVRTMSETRLRRELRVEPIAVCNLVVGVSRGVIQLLLAWLGYHYWALVIGNIAGEIAQTLWMWRAGGLPRRLTWHRETNSAAINFGLAAIGSTIFWIIFSTADNVVVGKLFGLEVLGYYAMAFYLTDLPLSKINTLLLPVASPYYSKLRHNTEELYRSFFTITRTVVAFIAPALVGLALVAPEFVPVVLGAQWVPMVVPLQVLSFVCLLRAMTANSSALLLAIGRPKESLLASAVPGIVLPPLFYFCGRAFGINGIYGTWLAVFPFVGPLFFFTLLSRVSRKPVRSFILNIRAPIISVGLLAAVLSFFTMVAPPIDMRVMLMAKIIIGAATYVAALLGLFPLEVSEGLGALKSVRK